MRCTILQHKKRVRGILSQTHAGGVCINDDNCYKSLKIIFRLEGSETVEWARIMEKGFDTFIHYKPVFHQSRFSLVPMLARPPYPNGYVFDGSYRLVIDNPHESSNII